MWGPREPTETACVAIGDAWWLLTHSAYGNPWPMLDYFGGLLISVTPKSISQEAYMPTILKDL